MGLLVQNIKESWIFPNQHDKLQALILAALEVTPLHRSTCPNLAAAKSSY